MIGLGELESLSVGLLRLADALGLPGQEAPQRGEGQGRRLDLGESAIQGLRSSAIALPAVMDRQEQERGSTVRPDLERPLVGPLGIRRTPHRLQRPTLQ